MRSGCLGSTMLLRAWAIGLCFILAACDVLQEGLTTPNDVAKSVPDTPPETREAIPPPEINTSTGENTTAVAEASPTPVAVPQPKPLIVAINAQSLIGMTQEEVLAQLGAPDDTQDAPPMLTWHYAVDPCDLTLQFFKELETDVFRALQYDVAGGEETPCLFRIERRARRDQSG